MNNTEALSNATSWVTSARNAEHVRSLAGRLQRVLHRYYGTKDQEKALNVVAHASTHLHLLLGTPWDVEWLPEDDRGLAMDAQAIALGHLQEVPPVAAEATKNNGSPSHTLLELEQVEDNLGDATSVLSRENLRDFADRHPALHGDGEASRVISHYLESVPFTDESTNDTVGDVVSWCAVFPPNPGCV